MSLIKANAVQIGQSPTATQNFTLAVPSSPDGTIKLARGNAGATTQDVISVDASGNVNGLVKSTGSTTARSLANRFADVINVRDFGAVGDGVADDTAAIQAANSASTSIFFPYGNYFINNNITLTSAITMGVGAKLIVASGKVLTINSPVYAGSRQYIFQGDSGAFVGTFGYVELWVDWFGAIPDASANTGIGTDSGVAINKAILAGNSATGAYGYIKFNSGNYLIETPVVVPFLGIVLEGAGKYNTILVCKTTFTGKMVSFNGTAGPPNMLRGMGVIAAVGGAFSATGIEANSNGTFISDVWIGGLGVGVKLNSTDQFVFDFACEYNLIAIYCTSSQQNISNGITFFDAQGIVIDNSATPEVGTITITNVRSSGGTVSGFVATNAKNVIFDSCSCSHINSGAYSTSGFNVDGSSDSIYLNNCVAKLGAQNATNVGFNISCLGAVSINNCVAINFNKGIYINTTGNVNVNGGTFIAKLHGIHATAYNFLNINNTQCNYNGQTGAADSGIRIEASSSYQRALVDGNICGATGGGAQDYGIYITCSNALSYGLVSNNITAFNNVSGLLIDGANSANFTSTSNIN